MKYPRIIFVETKPRLINSKLCIKQSESRFAAQKGTYDTFYSTDLDVQAFDGISCMHIFCMVLGA